MTIQMYDMTPSTEITESLENNLKVVLDNVLEKNAKKILVDEHLISSLRNDLLKLKEELYDLRVKQTASEMHLPESMIKSSKDIQRPRRMLRGLGATPLLESEIIEAKNKCKTAGGAARFLNVSYPCYKRYATLYGLFETHRHCREEWLIQRADVGLRPISKILNGEFPNYPIYRLKDKLIQAELKLPECEQCGYKERRVTDDKIPLLLHFEDGNTKNHKLENLTILCYNCTFCSGRGFIRRGTKYNLLEDPDRVQGAKTQILARF